MSQPMRIIVQLCIGVVSAALAACGGGGGGNNPSADPPVITFVDIMPGVANASTALLARLGVDNPRGYTLTTSYEWRRNGTLLNGQTTASLQPGPFHKGDTVSATVIVDNGHGTAKKTWSLVIADAPPRVALSPPSTVAYGSVLSTTATLVDPDGDPVPSARFVVRYGPSGLTVNPTTGLVTWQPRLPMFERAVDVHWSIATDNPAISPAEIVTRVEDSTRRYPLMRTGLPVPFGHELRVGDFDGDGKAEALLLGVGALYELQYAGGSQYRQAWAYPFAITGNSAGRSFAAHDVDGDGRAEIFVSAPNLLVELDGVDRHVVRSGAQSDRVCVQLEYADLDRDGTGELVCLAASVSSGFVDSVVVYSTADLSVRWEAPSANYGDAMAVGNVDADPALEIVTASGSVFDGATFAEQWRSPAQFGADVATGDLDGDGVEEIVAVGGVAGADTLRAYSAKPGAERQLLQRSTIGDADTVLLADIDGDSRAEIIVGQSFNVTGYRYDAASASANIVFTIPAPSPDARALATGDVDHDGQLDLVWATSGERGYINVASVQASPAVKWSNTDTGKLDGPFFGAALANGPASAEALIFGTPSTYDGLHGPRVVSMRPDDGDLTIGPELSVSENGIAITAADYDGDGTDEAIYATTTHVGAYDAFGASTEWEQPTSGLPSALVAGDLTGDGKKDAVDIVGNGTLNVYDIYSRAQLFSQFVVDHGLDLAIGDPDGDGRARIVALAGNTLSVYQLPIGPGPLPFGAGPLLLNARWFASVPFRALAVGDVDGDGTPEIVVVQGGDTSSSPGYLYILDADTEIRAQLSLSRAVNNVVIETAGPGNHNLLLSTLDNDTSTEDFAEIVAIDARNGAEIWRSPKLTRPVARGSLHYLESGVSGAPALSFGTDVGMFMTR